MKWKTATASVVTIAILSAPVAAAAPSDNANTVADNVVGQVVGQATGTDPAIIIGALNGLQGLLKKLGFGGGKDRGNGNGAELQKATLDNVGKTLKKPVVSSATP